LNPNDRRENILQSLKLKKEPLSGNDLAENYHVSRQIIVQDIAILRAGGHNIVATSLGYVLIDDKDNKKCKKVIASRHTKDQIEDELNTIVDMGGIVLDVIVEHDIYGQIQGNIMVSSRRDVSKFMKKINNTKIKPLSALTDGMHFHTIEAKNNEIIKDIEKELLKKKYLVDFF
jgi:transcriptional regulator of NAD metabolism